MKGTFPNYKMFKQFAIRCKLTDNNVFNIKVNMKYNAMSFQ